MAPMVQRGYVAFPSIQGHFREGVAQLVGVPLREGFCPREYLPREDVVKLLVLGGSQGAITLNQNVPAAIGMAHKRGATALRVVHQCGHERESEVVGRYQDAGVMDFVEIVPFIDDVPKAIAECDLVVQRAGASAIAEVCAIGRGSILIPYPYAAGDHQRHNALAMQEAGAAVCVESKEATSERLTEEIMSLVNDSGRRVRMAKAARERGCPEASENIARDLLALAEAR
jgi:UDP-N-acetylglucosamine--N-acetylmuramyl-(pentapeptide) pyrophosphoryl-undecaprenol N-acetylglucosamine transferase